MSRLLDVPWTVNEEAERISTHGGLATIDFNGTEKERREAMRLVAQAQEMAKVIRAVLARERGSDLRFTLGSGVLDDMRAVLLAAGVSGPGSRVGP